MKKIFFYSLNVFFKILYLFPKNKKIWIFGAWHGEKYSDNSKYFYEYVKKINSQNNLKIIWITKNKKLVNQKKIGEIYLNNSFRGIWYRLRAGVVFYTNGMQDFGEIDLSSGSYIVALWHGMPLKKIYFASNKFVNESNKYIKYIKILKAKLYNRCRRNLSIATSEETKEKLNECFYLLKNNEFLISGQPRNDILVKKDIHLDIKDIILTKDIPTFKKIITFMPTYRNIEKLKIEQKYRIEKLLNNLYLNEILEKEESLFIVKLHYLMDIKLEIKNKRILLLKDSEVECTQKLLKKTDILITDYSSVFIDYVLQEEKTTIFYGYDSKEYFEEDETGIFYNYDKIFEKYLIKDQDNLIISIKKYLKSNKGNNKELNLFFNKETKEYNFSEVIFKELEKKLKI